MYHKEMSYNLLLIFANKLSNMIEVFKQHPIYTEYQVGDKGTVNGIRKKNVGTTKEDGYRYVFIQGSWQYIHRLVYETFVGEIPEGLEINHKDGNRANNALDNLECLTHRANIKHSFDVLNRKVLSGKNHWNYGTIHKEETKQLMSEAKKGINHPKFTGYYVVDGIDYTSSYQAAEALGINYRTVIRRCKANKNGYSFKPLPTIATQ